MAEKNTEPTVDVVKEKKPRRSAVERLAEQLAAAKVKAEQAQQKKIDVVKLQLAGAIERRDKAAARVAEREAELAELQSIEV